jgi:hypothetical protein
MVMPGPPVTIGCNVVLNPGVAGPPDLGVITIVPQATLTASGQPLAVGGSICQMVNTLTGVPYPLPIPFTGTSTGVNVTGLGLVRMGDVIPAGPGVLIVLGPPAAPFVIDGSSP